MLNLEARLRALEQARDERLSALWSRVEARVRLVFTPEQYDVLHVIWNARREPETELEREVTAIWTSDAELAGVFRLLDRLLTGRAHARSNSGRRWDGEP